MYGIIRYTGIMGIYVHVIIFTTYHMYIVDMYARQGISLSCLLDSYVQLCGVRKVLAPPEAVDHACHAFQNTFCTCARDCDCNFSTDLLHQDHVRLTNAEYGLPEVEELLPTHVCCLPFAFLSEIV